MLFECICHRRAEGIRLTGGGRGAAGTSLEVRSVRCHREKHFSVFVLEHLARLDFWQDPAPFEPGSYILLRTAFVALDADNFSPDDEELVAELEEGEDSRRNHIWKTFIYANLTQPHKPGLEA